MYQPLPNSLTIQPSKVNGLGLFAKVDLSEDTDLGMSNLELGKLILRTPLGGFINHSSKPNCVKVKSLMTRQQWNNRADLPNDKYDHNFTRWSLITIKDIKAGEELTLKYTWYQPDVKENE